MAKNKTIETENSVTDFIQTFVEQEQKKIDSFELIDFLSECSGYPPKTGSLHHRIRQISL